MSYPNWSLSRGTVDANAEPLTLAAAALHLRYPTTGAQNTVIEALCTAVRQECEKFTNRSLAVSTYTLKLDHFPCGPLVLPVGVANAANVSVAYIDGDGAAQTWANTNYTIYQRQSQCPEIAPNVGAAYPGTRFEKDAVTVTFTSGTATVDAALLAGMKLFLGHLFENRTAVVVGTIATPLPLAVESLWTPYRVIVPADVA